MLWKLNVLFLVLFATEYCQQRRKCVCPERIRCKGVLLRIVSDLGTVIRPFLHLIR